MQIQYNAHLMALILDNTESAIRKGIKTVGVGKKGSRPLSAELAREILEDLKSGKVSDAAKGAFFAGLLAKGIEGDEKILGNDPDQLIAAITSDAPEFVHWVCKQILKGITLDRKTAYDLGKFLFSDASGDGARGFVASFLRVRYETDDEYAGIWQAMQETISTPFQTPTPPGDPIIQLSEPFDGNDKSYMITPILAHYVQGLGYRAVHMVGRNSGPKLIINLLDIAKALDITFAKGNADLAGPKPVYGWFFRQQDISPALDLWVDIRHQTVKRPFLATLEKFIKPLDAEIIAVSAFHPPYGEKMATLSERCGFPKVMVVRNGMEGSMAFPLKRPVKILLSKRQVDGQYIREEKTFDGQALMEKIPDVEEKRDGMTPLENARLIRAYMTNGTSGDAWFDLRVKTTCEGFRQALAHNRGQRPIF